MLIRRAEFADVPALRRLAALDSAAAPSGPSLVAEVGGELVAALPLGGGRAVADPFRHTAEAIDLLELRARQLRRADAGHGRRSPARDGLRALLKLVPVWSRG